MSSVLTTTSTTNNQTNQCWNCRRRRVRCDAERPECRKCRAKGLTCPGFGETKPLVWIKGPNARKPRKRKEPVKETDEADAAPRQSIEDGREDEKTQNTSVASITAVDDLQLKYIPEELASQVRCFEYYNRFVFPKMSPINTPCNPLRIDETSWHRLPPFFLDLFVLVVSRHELISSRCSGVLIERSQSRRKLELDITKRGAATYSAVNRRLSEAATKLDDFTLLAVFMFMLSEIQQSGIGRWKLHLEGVRALLKLRGGIGKVLETTFLPHIPHLLSYFIIIDVMRLTSSTLSADSNTVSQLEYLDILPRVLNEGFWTCFPCPEALVATIVHINALRSRSSEAVTWESASSLRQEILELFCKLSKYDPKAWASAAMAAEIRASKLTRNEWNTRVFSESPPPDGDDTEELLTVKERELKLWVSLANAYHAAVYLYFIRSVLLAHFSADSALLPKSTRTIEQIYQAQTTQLRETLDRLFNVRHARVPFHSFVFWPVFIAGLLSDPKDGETQKKTKDRLNTIAIQCGTQSPIDASVFLERHWKREQEREHKSCDWDHMWREEEAPCVFIV